jgi:hypothetical protein
MSMTVWMPHFAANPCRSLSLLVLAAAAWPAQAQSQIDPAQLQRCRSVTENAARLACYDAIALPPPVVRPEPGGRDGAAAAGGADAPQAPAGNPSAVQAGTSGTSPVSTFGLERRIVDAAPDQLSSRLAGTIDGWGPNARFTLENGQVWQVVDGSRAYYGTLKQPKVTINRGMLGSFYMSIEGVNQTPRVRRVE